VLGIANKQETIENHKAKASNNSPFSKEMVFNHLEISNSKEIIDRGVLFRESSSNNSNLGIKAIKGRINNNSNNSSKMDLNHGNKLLEIIDN